MHSTNPVLRRAAATTTALALATGGALFMSPAHAATSAELTYTCDVLGNPQTFTGKHTLAETVPYGGVAHVTTNVTIPGSLSAFLYGAGYRKVDGTVVNQANATVGGMTVPVESPAVIAKTAIEQSGPTTFTAEGGPSLKDYVAATPVGTTVDVSLLDRKNGENEASDMDASLYTYDSGGTQAGPVPVACELNDGQDLTVGTVTVVQADTKTAAKLIYKAKRHLLTSKGVVRAPDSGAPLEGKAKLTLKRNGTKIASATKNVSAKGIASMKLKHAKKGKYKLIVKYLGTDNFGTSSSNATKKLS